jgi:hypothetical protein
MRAAMSTLLTKTVDDGIIQSNPAHLAKYANVADSIASSGKSERRISSSIHRLPEVRIIGFGLNISLWLGTFFKASVYVREMQSRSELKVLLPAGDLWIFVKQCFGFTSSAVLLPELLY